MNLADLTEAARCTKCDGEHTKHMLAIDVSPEWQTAHCPRCKDHPGIDPDVITHEAEHVLSDLDYVPCMDPPEPGFDRTQPHIYIVIPVDPA